MHGVAGVDKMFSIPLGAIVSVEVFPFARHLGLYAGNGQVIEYGKKPFAVVRLVPVQAFARGREVHIEPDPPNSVPGHVAVNRGMSRLGERNYSLTGNNCEHFVNWAKTDERTSPQVQRAIVGLLALLLLGCVAAAD
jgi:hypothetical protein